MGLASKNKSYHKEQGFYLLDVLSVTPLLPYLWLILSGMLTNMARS